MPVKEIWYDAQLKKVSCAKTQIRFEEGIPSGENNSYKI